MKFRKKPVVIEAVQFDGTKESANQILGWIGSNGADAKRAHSAKPEHGVIISTLEGDMAVSPGDFVIRGVQGEFYPCKPDIFAKTYEFVELPAATSTNSSTIPDRWVMAPAHSEEALLDNAPGAATDPAKWRCQCPMCEHHRTAAAIINAEGHGINAAPALRLIVENATRLRAQIQERQG